MRVRIYITFFCLIFIALSKVDAQTHPSLTMSPQSLKQLRKKLNRADLFKQTLEATIASLDKEMQKGMDVPVPKDMAGGYTHETHRKNYQLMETAGYVYQITGDARYADFVIDGLLKYADLYPTLERHPSTRSYARGKLFWQCLNDANWLVSVSQAYDCIYQRLKVEDRDRVEGELLIPFARFLSEENPQFFNRIHNHSTWGCAAVGMLGLVLNDSSLVNRALYGYKAAGEIDLKFDNDGGLITQDGQSKSGFLAQIEGLFSPDGLYSEGAYYHRYGIYPFLIFAESLENTRPELNIFAYRDSLLIKSVYALLNQATSKGDFFPLNDAQKGMSIYNSSLVTAVDIAYNYGGHDPELLSIAEKQGRVTLNQSGLQVALDIDKAKELKLSSKIYRDGVNGDLGGIGILRTSGDLNLIFKAGSHGMGHGHFDQLSFSLYENGEEVVQDYGMARFVNIEQKAGGVYLPENKSFAKQTIGHNTLVVNQQTQYKGKTVEADKYSPELKIQKIESNNIQVISALDSMAYPGITLERQLVVVDDKSYFSNPVVVDIFKAQSTELTSYDYPVYFTGQLLETDFNYTPALGSMVSMGSADGYQHLWKEAEARTNKNGSYFSTLSHQRFYTFHFGTSTGDSLYLARTGAADPNFNLRRDPVFIWRKEAKGLTAFATLIEAHGSYTPVTEKAVEPYSTVENIKVLMANKTCSAVIITKKSKQKVLLVITNKPDQDQWIDTEYGRFQWNGNYFIQNINEKE
ncbi:alginate lyase family protein [Jiulongibacter sediminis]|uniref:alginate lyase family protein n=1 Tax=Jiulongibacter sediminis TaxID=1605367 RepID=UPI0026EE840D|nr:alginate lyase family protein [Jiulongibacter sediminis]